MILMSLAATLAATATPSAIPAPPPTVAVHAVPVASTTPRKPDLAEMLAMFDKLFPAGPAPDPGRLALALRLLSKRYPGAAPTLIKRLPLPLRRFIGDMSQTERILQGLGCVLQVVRAPSH